MANLLSVLFDAIRRIRGKKAAEKPPAWENFDLPPEEIEFFQELFPTGEPTPYRPGPESVTTRRIPGETLDVILSGVWIGVSSSNVEAWRFDLHRESGKNLGSIEVEFTSGAIYAYQDCSVDDAIWFAATPSSGKFVWRVFRENEAKHPWIQVRPPRRDPHTGKIVRTPGKAWRFKHKPTGKMLRSPKRRG